jgi:methylphosphotriester-DNA--protein-cysteine methyltransferase
LHYRYRPRRRCQPRVGLNRQHELRWIGVEQVLLQPHQARQRGERYAAAAGEAQRDHRRGRNG